LTRQPSPLAPPSPPLGPAQLTPQAPSCTGTVPTEPTTWLCSVATTRVPVPYDPTNATVGMVALSLSTADLGHVRARISLLMAEPHDCSVASHWLALEGVRPIGPNALALEELCPICCTLAELNNIHDTSQPCESSLSILSFLSFLSSTSSTRSAGCLQILSST
jgi:hypothetical protein